MNDYGNTLSFCKYLCNESSDLYEILNLSSYDSNELPKKFREDLCTHMHAHETGTGVFTPHTCVCMHGSS